MQGGGLSEAQRSVAVVQNNRKAESVFGGASFNAKTCSMRERVEIMEARLMVKDQGQGDKCNIQHNDLGPVVNDNLRERARKVLAESQGTKGHGAAALAREVVAVETRAQKLKEANDKRIDALRRAREGPAGALFLPTDGDSMVDQAAGSNVEIKQLEPGTRLAAKDLACMGQQLLPSFSSVVAGGTCTGFTVEVVKNQVLMALSEELSDELLEQCAITMKDSKNKPLLKASGDQLALSSKSRAEVLALWFGFMLAEDRSLRRFELVQRAEEEEVGAGGGGDDVIAKLL